MIFFIDENRFFDVNQIVTGCYQDDILHLDLANGEHVDFSGQKAETIMRWMRIQGDRDAQIRKNMNLQEPGV